MTEQHPTEHPVPDPAARVTARYDTDPDALAWARTRVQHQLDRLSAFEERATETGRTELAHGLSMARRSTEQLLLGGEGCVVGAFDERRPVMFAPAAEQPTADTLPQWLHNRFGPHLHGGDFLPWAQTEESDRSYWEHQAAAVRRAVARGGFKNPEPRPRDALRQLVNDVTEQLHDGDPASYHGDTGPGDCPRCATAGGEQA